VTGRREGGLGAGGEGGQGRGEEGETIGAGAAQLVDTMIEGWLEEHGRSFIVGEPVNEGELALFGLGEALARVYSLLDGRTRLGDLAARVRSPEARLNLLRLTYLLVQTDLARLS